MHKNILLLLLAVILTSFAPLTAKSINLGADIIIWWRCFIAFVFLWIILFFLKQHKFSLKFIIPMIISGIFLGLHWWTYFLAIQYSSVAIGILSLFTFPIITVFLEAFYCKIEILRHQIFSGFGILLGIYFLVPEFSLENADTKGVFWGVISALIFSCRNIITKYKLSEIKTMTTLDYQLLFASLAVSVPILFSLENFSFPSHQDFGFLFFLALFSTLGGHGLLIYSFKNFSASTVGIVGSLQVLFSTVFAFFLLSEVPNDSFYIGGGIILGISIYEILQSDKK